MSAALYLAAGLTVSGLEFRQEPRKLRFGRIAAKRRGKVLRDRRDARMDLVGVGRAFAIRDVAAGTQTLRIGRAVES